MGKFGGAVLLESVQAEWGMGVIHRWKGEQLGTRAFFLRAPFHKFDEYLA